MKAVLLSVLALVLSLSSRAQDPTTFTFSDTLVYEGKLFAQLDMPARVVKRNAQTRIVFNKDFEFSVDEAGLKELIRVLDGYLLVDLDQSKLESLGSVTATSAMAASTTKDSGNENAYAMTWGKGVEIAILYNGAELCIEFPEITSGVEPRIVKSNVHRFWVKAEDIEPMISALKK